MPPLCVHVAEMATSGNLKSGDFFFVVDTRLYPSLILYPQNLWGYPKRNSSHLNLYDLVSHLTYLHVAG